MPPKNRIPRHIAIVMDGNGRWARRQKRPRFWGHKRGVERVRSTVEGCIDLGVEALTLFAFSTENWRRPEEEVSFLMDLFMSSLKREVKRLHKNGIRLRVIGDKSGFSEKLQATIAEAEELTKDNSRLSLNIAANYGGRWDITEATRTLCHQVANGTLAPEQITEEILHEQVTLSDLPDPELFIRTGGEKRVSNFLLWQMAYCEFYFSDLFWPEFDRQALDLAVSSFEGRQRRFGRTGDQLLEEED
ncbi:MAG: isoprenyl transferase [Gammaproteobacteria bacterium]|uniref:Ditrans,polycis-undecaprenyl-diphosphate synthase ((2E,6E)-farnesyl-diphosphate specific) n=1 Tax=Candidatus Thiopontia autotrophica TaxID=2841688 RepID=A0A8J6TNP7_9GAMM|nr:isoprenyl transferase [Candidatus Thiopontia autotrophica]MBL6969659.1 isoprenyl transferase [Gammaproteobacteria bacterium]